MNLVSRISGEGRAEFLWTWGPDFDQQGENMWEHIEAGGSRWSGYDCVQPWSLLDISQMAVNAS